ncbi:hypothetical protein BDV18DRAFT_148781 [Aspergillus unguis]
MRQYCVLFAAIFGLVAFLNNAFRGLGTLGVQIYTLASQCPLNQGRPLVSFSKEWQILGPFPIGTREAIWGADPLEYHGGFPNLSYDKEAAFASPLSADGIVQWSLTDANTTNFSPEIGRAELAIAFPHVEWDFLQSVYGWSALQYQAWVRGYLHLHKSNQQTAAIFTDGILELVIDGHRYFGGDFYSYRRAPLILNIGPGLHVVELRLVRDVRAMGGQDTSIKVVVEAELREDVLTIDEKSLLVPETTDGRLGSVWASVNIQNNAIDWVEILPIDSPEVAMETTEQLAPHQTRPLVFRFKTITPTTTEFSVDIRYKILKDDSIRSKPLVVKLTNRPLSQPQRFTYVHPAGIVSYAILRPPPMSAGCAFNRSNATLPIVLGLHGAGLEADSMQARSMLDAAYGICAWMLFPSGVTSWSGDDWHTWGVADIKAAVNALSGWTRAMNWNGPGILADEWLAIGHSNGGQGVWFLATHYPDNVFAAAPVSGYTSIENYVPYQMWRDSEPLLSSVLYQSRASFKHELLLANTAGIPILQQHGSNDTNVPAFHSRLMHGFLEESGWPSTYVELPHQGHWYEGVMTTPLLLKFYEDSLRLATRNIPLAYTIYVPPSGDMVSKGGICVDQLQSPDKFGQLRVRIDMRQQIWHIQTHNVHRFHLSAKICATGKPTKLVLEGTEPHFRVDPIHCGSTWYIKNTDDTWKSSNRSDWQSMDQRYGRQVGAMDAILRSNGKFIINICSAGTEDAALQISRNLLQYFAADTHITSQCSLLNTSSPGNIITLSVGNELPDSLSRVYPVRVADRHIILQKGCLLVPGSLNGQLDPDSRRSCDSHIFDHEAAMGALFLRPMDNERLELVVWGTDIDGFEQAARLVPTLTGAGQPEFVILGKSCRWKGHAGLYAAGHFDKFWQISAGSYIADRL